MCKNKGCLSTAFKLLLLVLWSSFLWLYLRTVSFSAITTFSSLPFSLSTFTASLSLGLWQQHFTRQFELPGLWISTRQLHFYHVTFVQHTFQAFQALPAHFRNMQQ